MALSLVALPSAIICAPLTDNSYIDDLPLPNPPTDWVMSSCRTKVKQTMHTVDFEYEYKYTPAPEQDRELKGPIDPPVIPSNWRAIRARHTAEKDEYIQTYTYILSYRSPTAPPEISMEEDKRLAELTAMYEVLQVEESASRKEIRDAYLREARMWHPDKTTSTDASERFKAVSEAYRMLSGISQDVESIFTPDQGK